MGIETSITEVGEVPLITNKETGIEVITVTSKDSNEVNLGVNEIMMTGEIDGRIIEDRMVKANMW